MDLQTKIQDLLNELVASTQEHGLQVVVYHKGACVVDAFAGYMEAGHKSPVTSETLFPVFSCSKGITSTILHRLAERGLVDYETPIAEYWPGFSANGKGNIRVRHALTHTAGLWAMPETADLKMAADWDAACDYIAGMPAKHAPGERTEYHAITFGWLVGNIACLVSGLSFRELVAKEICEPLDIRNLYIGMPESERPRVATLYEDIHEDAFDPPHDAQLEAIPMYVRPLHAMMNRPEMQAASIPATSGVMTAKALAKHYASLLPGGVDGVQLLPDSRIKLATERPDFPHLIGIPAPFSLGYGTREEWNQPGKARTFSHGGYGGSLGMADPNRKLAVALTKNYLNRGDNSERILSLIRNHFS
ncbi:serine hydrolase domain-containing protein [Coraliomargarita parva]|uniref:serine hydrolase domain-containing protein n=1 Tax=Coraliomargarita parva TaxID=3014050 RepID=UPI0022B42E93|nr:serine hydrolase domain-containing protein [Coraliomargarita parva]